MLLNNYRCLLVDPPWRMKMAGRYNGAGGRHERPRTLPYHTMTLEDIYALPVGDLAERGAHLWLWLVNEFWEHGPPFMRHWGFTYLAPITWAKPSGFGNYFISRTEHLLFGYKERCQFNRARYVPNYYEETEPAADLEPIEERYHWGRPKHGQHSRKPEASYRLIESVSDEPRLELFARPPSPLFPIREGWMQLGDGMDGMPIRESIAQLEVMHGTRF